MRLHMMIAAFALLVLSGCVAYTYDPYPYSAYPYSYYGYGPSYYPYSYRPYYYSYGPSVYLDYRSHYHRGHHPHGGWHRPGRH